MKLTVEEDRERIKRYAHIRPAPRWGAAQCSVRCPGTQRSCTLRKAHSGLHVAHSRFGKVVAVWDLRASALKPDERKRRAPRGSLTTRSRENGALAGLKALRRLVVRRFPSIEEVVFLGLALAMVGFAIDWALRILGLK